MERRPRQVQSFLKRPLCFSQLRLTPRLFPTHPGPIEGHTCQLTRLRPAGPEHIFKNSLQILENSRSALGEILDIKKGEHLTMPAFFAIRLLSTRCA
jgi:hypothetical protein